MCFEINSREEKNRSRHFNEGDLVSSLQQGTILYVSSAVIIRLCSGYCKNDTKITHLKRDYEPSACASMLREHNSLGVCDSF